MKQTESSGESTSKNDLRRIDSKFVFAELAEVLNFEKGIFFTVKEMLIRPANAVHHYLYEDRTRLVKPILFLVICSVVYTVLQQTVNFEDGYISFKQASDSNGNLDKLALFRWFTENWGYTNILLTLFIGAYLKLLFFKQRYSYFENLILLCYVVGTGMLWFTTFGVIDALIYKGIHDKGYFLGVIYMAWAIGSFYKGNKILNVFKGFLGYVFGLMSFFLVSFVISLIYVKSIA